jgi:hypothetical protein
MAITLRLSQDLSPRTVTPRDERRRVRQCQIAEYALPVDGELAAAGRRRTDSSGGVSRALSFSCMSVALPGALGQIAGCKPLHCHLPGALVSTVMAGEVPMAAAGW